jgi:hypothetical protein
MQYVMVKGVEETALHSLMMGEGMHAVNMLCLKGTWTLPFAKM